MAQPRADAIAAYAKEIRIARTGAADQVAEGLSDMIRAGHLRPGTALRERVLAESLDVSRNTIREAIRILVGGGLVRHSAHRGATVASLSASDVEEIYRVRHILEVAGIHEFATAMTDRLDGVRSALEGLEVAAASQDWVQMVNADIGFHTELVRFLRSDRLTTYFRLLCSELRLGLQLMDRSTQAPGEWIDEHRRLYNLLRKGQPDKAANLLTLHLTDAQGRLNQVLRDLGRVSG
jgi:DNA-binding GntR family transcriptional regulator